MVVVMYLIFIVSLCHFNCLVAFIKSYLTLLWLSGRPLISINKVTQCQAL